MGISQSALNWSMFDGISVTVAGWRGIGRSCTPNARVERRPTIEPTAMPSIAGAIIFDSPAIIDIIGSPASSSSSAALAGGVPRAVARSVKRWR